MRKTMPQCKENSWKIWLKIMHQLVGIFLTKSWHADFCCRDFARCPVFRIQSHTHNATCSMQDDLKYLGWMWIDVRVIFMCWIEVVDIFWCVFTHVYGWICIHAICSAEKRWCEKVDACQQNFYIFLCAVRI